MPVWLAVCLASFLLLLTSPAYADTKTIVSESTYIMGDGESPSFAEAMALQKAKQLALEEAGTYVESYTKTLNQELTEDEIQTLAGGVVQVEVQEKTRTLVSEGLRVHLKIRATVTTDKMEELAQRIKGKNVAEEYKNLRVKYEDLAQELGQLKRTIEESPPSPKRDAALIRIRQQEQSFVELQRDETALFEKLVQGDSLVAEAKKVLNLSDTIMQSVLGPGLQIDIGQIKPKLLREPPGTIALELAVTLRISEHLSAALQKVAREKGATIEQGAVYHAHLDRIGPSRFFIDFQYTGFTEGDSPPAILKANLIRFPNTNEISEEMWHLRRRLERLWLVVNFSGEDGTLAECRLQHWGLIYPSVQLLDQPQELPSYAEYGIRKEVTANPKNFSSQLEYEEYKRLEENRDDYNSAWLQTFESVKREEIFHVVKPGETFVRIGRRYKVDPKTLMEWNALPNEVVEVGQKLIVGFKEDRPAALKDLEKRMQEAEKRSDELYLQARARWWQAQPPVLPINPKSTGTRREIEHEHNFLLVVNEPITITVKDDSKIYEDPSNRPLPLTMPEQMLKKLQKTTAHMVEQDWPLYAVSDPGWAKSPPWAKQRTYGIYFTSGCSIAGTDGR